MKTPEKRKIQLLNYVVVRCKAAKMVKQRDIKSIIMRIIYK